MAKARLFQSQLIIDTISKEEADDLLNDFRLYKEKGVLPTTFGRNAPYNHTHHRSYLELQHIHIRRDGKHFPVSLVQFQRKSGHVL
ncbi:type II toxin-antitoxin system YafO family toxin [Endozoicomonas sp. 2B-B]